MEWDGTALDDDQLSCTGYSGNELKLGSSFTRLGNYRKLFRPSQGAACLTVQDVLSAIAQTELHYRRAIATCPSTCMLGPLSRLAACGRAGFPLFWFLFFRFFFFPPVPSPVRHVHPRADFRCADFRFPI